MAHVMVQKVSHRMAHIADQFTALADPTRRKLFERLARRAVPVGELARGIEISRPAVSQHLKVLKLAGLLTVRKHGTQRIYAVDPKGVEAMRAYLDKFWDRALQQFKLEAERSE